MKILFRHFLILICLFLLSSIKVFGQEDFSSFLTDEDVPILQWSGKGNLNTRYSIDYNNPFNSLIDVYPEINLDLDYIGERTEFHGKIGFTANLPSDPIQLLNETFIQFYFDYFNIELGYLKLTWGKGDDLYTFDTINALNYTDFINTSYIDQKIPESMIKINFPFGMQGMVEAVYTPVFTSDIHPDTGEDWNQTAFNSISISDTVTLTDGQLGFRITNSINGFDLGASYQFTFLRDSLTDSNYTGPSPTSWDRVHLFGAESAFVVLAFNIWAEAAYYLTMDLSGDDPLVHNNRLIYLAGFSRDLMIHNLSLNIQVRSEQTLNVDRITGTSDIDYNSETLYNSYLLTAGLKNSFLNEKITAEINSVYSIENKDFMITPEIRINLIEDTRLNMKYTIFYGDSDTLFGQFKNNDFFEIRMEYSF